MIHLYSIRFFLLNILILIFANHLIAEQEIRIKSIDAQKISTLEDESLLMEGSVKIITNQFDLETSKAIYNKKTGKLILEGNVKLLAEKIKSLPGVRNIKILTYNKRPVLKNGKPIIY